MQRLAHATSIACTGLGLKAPSCHKAQNISAFLEISHPMQEEERPSKSIAQYIDIGFRGIPKDCSIDPCTILSMSPSRMLVDQAVDIFLYHAASILRKRAQADVRVVETAIFKTWRDWACIRPGQLVDKRPKQASLEPPDLLKTSNMAYADYIILPWSDRIHYSLAIICNAGTLVPTAALNRFSIVVSSLMLLSCHTRIPNLRQVIWCWTPVGQDMERFSST